MKLIFVQGLLRLINLTMKLKLIDVKCSPINGPTLAQTFDLPANLLSKDRKQNISSIGYVGL
jgi:hypothetical protein